jgi:hypothetical protein
MIFDNRLSQRLTSHLWKVMPTIFQRDTTHLLVWSLCRSLERMKQSCSKTSSLLGFRCCHIRSLWIFYVNLEYSCISLHRMLSSRLANLSRSILLAGVNPLQMSSLSTMSCTARTRRFILRDPKLSSPPNLVASLFAPVTMEVRQS